MSRRRPQQGFVLVLTIWILAAIAIGAAYFGERVQKSVQLAQQRQGATDALIALSDARAEMLFRLTTTPTSNYGLGDPPQAIALDDRVYRLGRTEVQLQDARGLFNLNHFGDEQMRRFLTTLGVPADRHGSLVDMLRDYEDEDDLQRLNGAEAPQYRQQGLEPPRNAPLLTTAELRRVMGWRELPQFRPGAEAYEWVSVDDVVSFNPNTAPWQVLTMLPGVTEPLARAVVARRQLEPLNTALMSQMLGVELGGALGAVLPFPSDTLRMTLAAPGLPWALRYNVRLTPQGAVSPWQVTYFYRLERHVNAGASPDASDPPVLPPRVVLPASSPSLASG